MAESPSTQGTEDDVFTFESAANKEFPLAPEGPHQVIVEKAIFSLKENKFKPAAGKQPTVSLHLLSTQEYEDKETKNKRRYKLFITMKISDHEKATMFDFFNSVLGMPVPLTEDKKITLANKKVKPKEGEEGEEKIHLPQFENLEFSIIVKHKKGEDDGKMRDRVDSWFATPEQKVANAALFRGAA